VLLSFRCCSSLLLAFVILLAVVGSPGCVSSSDPFADGYDDPGGGIEITDLDVQMSALAPAVAVVAWRSDEAGAPAVEFGLDGALDRRTTGRAVGDGVYEAVLLGLKPLRDYSFRALMETESGIAASGDGEFTTGQVEPLAGVTVTGEFPDTDRGLMVAVVMSDEASAVILDTDGEVTWRHDSELALAVKNTTALVSGALSFDRRSMLFEDVLGEDDEFVLTRVDVVDQSTEVVTDTTAFHHDFTELPDGTVALMDGQALDVEGLEVWGDRIVEVAPDGTQEEIWSIWDDVECDLDVFPWVEQMEFADFTHFNAIDYEPDEDAYYVSSFTLDALFKVDRSSGELLWQLGGALGDFEAVGDTKPFDGQHQFDVIPGGIVIMDDGVPGGKEWARVVEYSLDLDAGTYRQEWEYIADPPLTNYILGDVTRLESGNTLVTWSEHGQIDLVDPDGTLLWRLNLPLGSAIGYLNWYPARDL